MSTTTGNVDHTDISAVSRPNRLNIGYRNCGCIVFSLTQRERAKVRMIMAEITEDPVGRLGWLQEKLNIWGR